MLHLVAELTPPQKGSKRAAMTPETFLTDPETFSPLKRKMKLDLTPNKSKALRLDPAPSRADSTICDYHERLHYDHQDRDKLHVMLPVLDTWTDIQVEIEV